MTVSIAPRRAVISASACWWVFIRAVKEFGYLCGIRNLDMPTVGPMNLNRGISHGDHLHRRGDAAAWGGMAQPGNSITCTRVLPVRAQRCPPVVGLVWRTLPNPMIMRDHPRPLRLVGAALACPW